MPWLVTKACQLAPGKDDTILLGMVKVLHTLRVANISFDGYDSYELRPSQGLLTGQKSCL